MAGNTTTNTIHTKNRKEIEIEKNDNTHLGLAVYLKKCLAMEGGGRGPLWST